MTNSTYITISCKISNYSPHLKTALTVRIFSREGLDMRSSSLFDLLMVILLHVLPGSLVVSFTCSDAAKKYAICCNLPQRGVLTNNLKVKVLEAPTTGTQSTCPQATIGRPACCGSKFNTAISQTKPIEVSAAVLLQNCKPQWWRIYGREIPRLGKWRKVLTHSKFFNSVKAQHDQTTGGVLGYIERDEENRRVDKYNERTILQMVS